MYRRVEKFYQSPSQIIFMNYFKDANYVIII